MNDNTRSILYLVVGFFFAVLLGVIIWLSLPRSSPAIVEPTVTPVVSTVTPSVEPTHAQASSAPITQATATATPPITEAILTPQPTFTAAPPSEAPNVPPTEEPRPTRTVVIQNG